MFFAFVSRSSPIQNLIPRCNSIFSICFQQYNEEPLYIFDAIMKGVVDHSSGQNQTSLLKKVLDRVKPVLSSMRLCCPCVTSLIYQMEKKNIPANEEAWVSISLTGSSRGITNAGFEKAKTFLFILFIPFLKRSGNHISYEVFDKSRFSCFTCYNNTWLVSMFSKQIIDIFPHSSSFSICQGNQCEMYDRNYALGYFNFSMPTFNWIQITSKLIGKESLIRMILAELWNTQFAKHTSNADRAILHIFRMKRISMCYYNILPHQRPYIVQAAFRYSRGKAIAISNVYIYAIILPYLPEKQCKKIKKTTVSKTGRREKHSKQKLQSEKCKFYTFTQENPIFVAK